MNYHIEYSKSALKKLDKMNISTYEADDFLSDELINPCEDIYEDGDMVMNVFENEIEHNSGYYTNVYDEDNNITYFCYKQRNHNTITVNKIKKGQHMMEM